MKIFQRCKEKIFLGTHCERGQQHCSHMKNLHPGKETEKSVLHEIIKIIYATLKFYLMLCIQLLFLKVKWNA